MKNLNKMKLDEELLTFVNGGALVPREDTILVDEDDSPYHGKNVPGGNEDIYRRR